MIYRTVYPAAAVGIFFDDFLASMALSGTTSGAVGAVMQLVSEEPSHALNDLPGPGTRIRVILLDPAAIQLDFALNTIPQGTVILPTGITGTGSGATDVFVRLLRSHPIRRRIRARVYVRLDTTDGYGADSVSDLPPLLSETVMAFDGFLAGIGVDSSGRVTLSLVHVLSALADSSILSAALAPTTAGNLSFQATGDPFIRPPNTFPSGLWAGSSIGMVAASIGASRAAEVDLWGYWLPDPAWGTFPLRLIPVPPRLPTIRPAEALGAVIGGVAIAIRRSARSRKPPRRFYPPNLNEVWPEVVPGSFGLQHYFYTLTGQDLFNWAATGDLNQPLCWNRDVSNAGAIAGLMRLEPFGGSIFRFPVPLPMMSTYVRDYGGPYPGPHGSMFYNISWRILARILLGSGSSWSTDRGGLIRLAGASYYNVGYRYGVPLAFRMDSALPPLGSGPTMGFAHSLMAETLQSLGQTTLWSRLVDHMLPQYMLALAPMADRGLIVPVHATPERSWLTLTADEIDGWQETTDTPVPVRGVILLGRRLDFAGLISAGNNPVDFGSTAHAVYDSCDPGQFLAYQAPAWLIENSIGSAQYGGATTWGIKRAANDPRTRAQAQRVTRQPLLDRARTFFDFRPGAPARAPLAVASMGYRLARSFWARERLKHRTAVLSTAPRFDIGPGSTITVELPTDRATIRPPLADLTSHPSAIRAAASGLVTGIVSAVSLVLDSETKTASTRISLNFVRTVGEALFGPLAGTPHPIWRISWYGCPLAHTVWSAHRLQHGSTIGG